MRPWHVGAAIAVALACHARTSPVAPAPCLAPVVDVSDWHLAVGRDFALLLPPGFTRLARTGVDIYATDDASSTLNLDFGPLADQLFQQAIGTAHASCHVLIDGFRATVITAREHDGWYVAAAAWDFGPGGKLVMIARTHDPAIVNQMLVAFRTTKIRTWQGS